MPYSWNLPSSKLFHFSPDPISGSERTDATVMKDFGCMCVYFINFSVSFLPVNNDFTGKLDEVADYYERKGLCHGEECNQLRVQVRAVQPFHFTPHCLFFYTWPHSHIMGGTPSGLCLKSRFAQIQMHVFLLSLTHTSPCLHTRLSGFTFLTSPIHEAIYDHWLL